MVLPVVWDNIIGQIVGNRIIVVWDVFGSSIAQICKPTKCRAQAPQPNAVDVTGSISDCGMYFRCGLFG